MTSPLDILVHISGPSLGRDDARYRTEARGFLEFESVEQHTLCELEENRVDDSQESGDITYSSRESEILGQDQYGEEVILHNTGTEESGRERFSAGKSKPSGAAKANRSKGWHAGNRQPNYHGKPDAEGKERKVSDRTNQYFRSGAHAGDASVGRLSTIQEDFLMKLQKNYTPVRQSAQASGRVKALNQPTFAAKTPLLRRPDASSTVPCSGVKETPYLLISRTPALPRPRTAPTEQSSPPEQIPILRRTQSDSWQTPPSTIPDSQPNIQTDGSPEISSSPCLKRPFLSSSPSPTRNSPPGAKRSRLQVPSSPPMEEPAPEKSPPSPPPPSSSPPPLPTALEPVNGIPSSSPPPSPQEDFQIHPPQPKPSNNKFTTHITPCLARLSSELPLTRGFTPFIETQTRGFETLERGHWLIPLSTWDTKTKTEFWHLLRIYIGEGHVGFGVRAWRVWVDTRDGTETAINVLGSAPNQIQEVAKIYCWGEVVGEVWLLLFIGSKKGVRGIGAKWIDSGGEEVLVMK